MATKKPILQALILADHIYTDISGKKIIAGTFSKLLSSKFPAHLDRMTHAYICFREVHNETIFQLRYVNLSSKKVLMETQPIKFSSKSPLESTEIVVEVPPFEMPHPGAYAFEVHCGGELLGSLRIIVVPIEGLPK